MFFLLIMVINALEFISFKVIDSSDQLLPFHSRSTLAGSTTSFELKLTQTILNKTKLVKYFDLKFYFHPYIHFTLFLFYLFNIFT
jgi:hypothetical protein